MDVTRKLTDWRESHQNMWVIPFLRIVLGVAIFAKIIFFIMHSDQMESAMMDATDYMPFLFGHWMPLLEIGAGILISIGLLTRVSALLQIPLFIAALFFSGHSAVLSSFEHSQTLLSLLILVLSVFFVYWGSGIFSAKRALIKENRREEDHFWHRDEKE